MLQGAGSRAFSTGRPPSDSCSRQALSSALPGWGVNGFYLVKKVRSKQPQNQQKGSNPGSSQQGVDQLPGSAEQPQLWKRRGQAGAARGGLPPGQTQVLSQPVPGLCCTASLALRARNCPVGLGCKSIPQDAKPKSISFLSKSPGTA